MPSGLLSLQISWQKLAEANRKINIKSDQGYKDGLKTGSSCLITDGSSALADYTAQREQLSVRADTHRFRGGGPE